MNILKTLTIICLTLFFSSNNLYSQENEYTKEVFKVWGNCEMCKTTIEKPFKKMEGVKSVKWNVASKKMMVKYDAAIISLDEIKKTIASVGYDTEEFRAPDEVYSKLHGCCQYERPATKAD
jgi:copper chaperone CopZ